MPASMLPRACRFPKISSLIRAVAGFFPATEQAAFAAIRTVVADRRRSGYRRPTMRSVLPADTAAAQARYSPAPHTCGSGREDISLRRRHRYTPTCRRVRLCASATLATAAAVSAMNLRGMNMDASFLYRRLTMKSCLRSVQRAGVRTFPICKLSPREFSQEFGLPRRKGGPSKADRVG